MNESAERQILPVDSAIRLPVRALLIADRLTADRTGYKEVLSTAPFCFRINGGYGVIFRYGAVVLVGVKSTDESAILSQFLQAHTMPIEEENLELVIKPDQEEGPTTSGTIQIKDFTPGHVLVLADILAKSVTLSRYEREIAQVFDTIEPTANTLALSGRIPKGRKALLQLIGAALLAQHRVSGRIAFAEKPDILWEHPELERFYARLEDEYEIIERGALLNGKVGVVASAAETFTDMIDTARSTRLEILIVILIFAELIIAAAALFRP
jgi:required for meiotic nuclear division protein 1